MGYREEYYVVRGNLSTESPLDLSLINKYSLADNEHVVSNLESVPHALIQGYAHLHGSIFYRKPTTDLLTHISVIDFDEYCFDYFFPFLNENDIILDVGAYVGSFGYLAKLVKPSLRVTLIEPEPENCKYIRMLFEENGLDYSLCQVALGDEDTTVNLQKPQSGSHSYVSQTMGPQNHRSENTVLFEVTQSKLSTIFRQHLIGECAVLKIDIEGAEWMVLEDLCLTGMIQKCMFITGEYHGIFFPEHFESSDPQRVLKSLFAPTHDLYAIRDGSHRKDSSFAECFSDFEESTSQMFCAIRR